MEFNAPSFNNAWIQIQEEKLIYFLQCAVNNVTRLDRNLEPGDLEIVSFLMNN